MPSNCLIYTGEVECPAFVKVARWTMLCHVGRFYEEAERKLMDHAPSLDSGGFRLCLDSCARLAAKPPDQRPGRHCRGLLARLLSLEVAPLFQNWVLVGADEAA
jgi:hypothetical protein